MIQYCTIKVIALYLQYKIKPIGTIMQTEYQISQYLESLYTDLDRANTMSESEVCDAFNVDFKHEIIDILNDEIEIYENALEEVA